MLRGTPLFEGGFGEVLRAHRKAPPPLDELRAVSPALADVVGRCLAKRPEDRFQSAAELAGALERTAEVVSRPHVPAATVAGRESTETRVAPSGTAGAPLRLSLQESRRTKSGTVYDLVVSNPGPLLRQVSLSAAEGADRCFITVRPMLEVPPGSDVHASVDVRAREGQRRSGVPFSVAASDGMGPPAVAAARYNPGGFSRAILAAVAAGIVALLVAGVAYALVGGGDDDPKAASTPAATATEAASSATLTATPPATPTTPLSTRAPSTAIPSASATAEVTVAPAATAPPPQPTAPPQPTPRPAHGHAHPRRRDERLLVLHPIRLP